jgi:hypothetical protein
MMDWQNTQISPINISLIIGLVALLLVQMYLIWKQKTISKSRQLLRYCLNLLLFGLVALWVLQPSWSKPAKSQDLILKSDEVDSEFIQKIADSLVIKNMLTVSDFERKIKLKPDFIASLNRIYLVGQSFKPELLSRIVAKNLVWQPYFKPNLAQNLQWQGILRKGETQTVSGKIEVDSPQNLVLKLGEKTLDSVYLNKEATAFKLSFPVFSLGKTAIDLVLDKKTIETIHFFADKSHPFNVLMILENQDFESKILADFLAKNGHSVSIKTTVAKNTLASVGINQKENQQPDLVITTPVNCGHEAVKKAFFEGKNVLFFNFSNPENEILAINSALGTGFKTKRLSNENELKINESLMAFPFDFIPKMNQKLIKDLPIIIQKNKAKIGISLLKQTFQLQLSGDSLAYRKTWIGVFEMLQPSIKNSFAIEAPILMNQPTDIQLNDFTIKNEAFQPSSISSKSLISKQFFKQADWQNLTDSLEIYVEKEPNLYQETKDMKSFMIAYNQGFNIDYNPIKISKENIPDWAWLLAFLICLTALWIEPKF